MSIRDRYIAALTARGETKVDYPSKKYVVFTRKGYDGFYFIGKSGALRYGSTVANSWPMSPRAKIELLLGKPEAAMGERKAAALSKAQL